MGGALLIVTAATSYATALLLGVQTTLAIDALSAITAAIGVVCLRIPAEKRAETWAPIRLSRSEAPDGWFML